jgi:large subunit ribosomal protein L13
MQTTYTKQELMKPVWYSVDAQGQIVGRLAVRIAKVLSGKHKRDYTPHVDGGDFVVVTGAAGLRLSRDRNEQQKVYRHHTGYAGGLKAVPFLTLKANRPEEILRLAVRRMLPKTTLARHALSKLRIYRGADHPHAAQQPRPLP